MIIRLLDNYTQFYIRAIADLSKARIKLIENNVNKSVGLRLNLLNTSINSKKHEVVIMTGF
ncbi:hypothetical protein OA07_15660 [Aphanizomenon flos-aquae 2012/KM1/D3]|jgi:hypothetical protein|nr:hypothetical protein OA07_15660 [Aphanizomenon flos-aquae 2012/KM1/D3]OBQ22135.1 MAG: hypothetical protein AN486_03055 [Anabaena sp. AL93]